MGLRVLNFNVGVLGHVDCGKTSLVKALSTVASTAAFDKNPQSQERGITLDLGFSSFTVSLPDHIQKSLRDSEVNEHFECLQFTMVDCPGHASLIRTIIGGARIIDMMALVIDVTKGMQTQTAECLVIGEILCEKMIIVLNKIDLIEESSRQATIDKVSRKLMLTLGKTRFAGSTIVAVAANAGSVGSHSEVSGRTLNLDQLISTMVRCSYLPSRSSSGPFVLAVDHCFLIKGQGTVMTGTIIGGSVKTNDTIEIPALQVQKKVKSIQMFKKPVEFAKQGDRIGLCVTQFDATLLERGLACTPGSMHACEAGIMTVTKIIYYKAAILSRAKYHLSVGYDTVMARVTFFSDSSPMIESLKPHDFSLVKQYLYEEQIADAEKPNEQQVKRQYYALVEFERPVICAERSVVIASKLDTDVDANVCRIAFHGTMAMLISEPKYSETILPQLQIYKPKCKTGVAERATDESTIICKNLFKKETNIQAFVGLSVTLSTGEIGVIDSSFGKSGKFKVKLSSGLGETARLALLPAAGKKLKDEGENAMAVGQPQTNILVTLNFKRYVFSRLKDMKQT